MPLSISTDVFMTSSMSDFVHKMCDVGVHPNALTLTSIVTTISMCFFHASGGIHRVIIPVMMMFKWFADAVDGDLARKCKCTSDIGGMLDALADAVFVAIVVALFVDGILGKRYTWAKITSPVLIPVCLMLSMMPWIVIGLTSGWSAIAQHSQFKNDSGMLNTILWNVTENTIITIGITAILYSAFIIPRNIWSALFTRITSKTPSIMVLMSFTALFVFRAFSTSFDIGTIAASLVLILPTLLFAYIVAFIPSTAGFTLSIALIVFVASCISWSCQRLTLRNINTNNEKNDSV